jgi:hypothetical protein
MPGKTWLLKTLNSDVALGISPPRISGLTEACSGQFVLEGAATAGKSAKSIESYDANLTPLANSNPCKFIKGNRCRQPTGCLTTCAAASN